EAQPLKTTTAAINAALAMLRSIRYPSHFWFELAAANADDSMRGAHEAKAQPIIGSSRMALASAQAGRGTRGVRWPRQVVRRTGKTQEAARPTVTWARPGSRK